MVARSFTFHHERYAPERLNLFYSVGQPMGALSSWAMLAVTHHFIVQYAARISGNTYPGKWYDNYELLGDDIILFDESVANTYLMVMKSLGLEINLSKSVCSSKNQVNEFAKVTTFKGVNVSAISWKMFISQNTMMGRANIAYSLLSKGVGISYPVAFVRAVTRLSPWSKVSAGYSYTLIALLTMYTKSGRFEVASLVKSLMSEAFPGRALYKNVLSSASISTLENLLAKLSKSRTANVKTSDLRDRLFFKNEMWLKDSLMAEIEA